MEPCWPGVPDEAAAPPPGPPPGNAAKIPLLPPTPPGKPPDPAAVGFLVDGSLPGRIGVSPREIERSCYRHIAFGKPVDRAVEDIFCESHSDVRWDDDLVEVEDIVSNPGAMEIAARWSPRWLTPASPFGSSCHRCHPSYWKTTQTCASAQSVPPHCARIKSANRTQKPLENPRFASIDGSKYMAFSFGNLRIRTLLRMSSGARFG